jgi:cobalt-zinc-cadmium resistance protein CzcA
MRLRELNEWVVKPRLLRAKGVVEVANFGGLAKQYAVRLDPRRMLQSGVKLQDVKAAIAANNSSGGGSLMERGGTSLVIRGLGQVGDWRELANIFIKNSNGTQVFVRDVGEVVEDHVQQTGIFGQDADPDGVEGIVIMLRGANPSVALRNIKDAIKDLNETILPKGVEAKPYYDRTTLINETLHTVFHNTLEGIGLVVVILLAFLGSPQIALIVALTIPGSLLFALLLMKLTGIPISLLSLGSIDFGIIVDGAIITAENIVRHLAMLPKGANQDDAQWGIELACEQIQGPMLFAMLMVIVAYLPLLTLRYIEGLLFRPMAITLCFALIGAVLIALYLVPVLCSLLFKPGAFRGHTNIFDVLTPRYERLIYVILRRRKQVVYSALVFFAVVLALIVPRLGTEFLPYMDEGGFWLRASFPEGISLRENAYYGSQIRGIIREFDEVDHVVSQSGRNDDGTDPFPVNRCEFDLILKPRRDWKGHKTKLALEADLRRRLQDEFPTVRFNLTQPIIDSVTEDTNGTSADLAVELVGPDLSQLRALAERTVDILKKVPGHVNVAIEQEGPQPQLQIQIDKSRLAHYQLSADSVNDVINTAVGGLPVSALYEGERRFDIVVRYAKEFVSSPQAIGVLPVFNDQGEAIPLAQVAQIRVVDGQTLVARADNKRRITVRTDIRGRSQGGFVSASKGLFASAVTLPAGYGVQWLGMFENLERARRHFALLIPMTLAIIFFVLFLAFGSLRSAFLIILTMPFALFGGLLALWVRGMHLSVSAGVGLTSLFGVATMHGVLMVSYIRQLHRVEGRPLNEAIAEGASLRLRPVIMTAVVAILGLLPASLATGIGSDVQRPIATVIVWGLTSSAFLNLLILPPLYHMIDGLSDKIKRRRLRAQPAA